MSLPKLDVPTYNLTVPSTGESIKIRPFLVREQKQLLIAQNGDVQQQTQAVLDIVQACTFNTFDVQHAPAYDAEYLFMQIRARSVGENIDLVLTCSECENRQDGNLDITTVEVKKTAGHGSNVDLGSGLAVTLAEPDLLSLQQLREEIEAGGNDAVINLIARSIRNIWKGDENFAALDYSQAELIEFVENLSPRNLENIQEFFRTQPVLRHELEFDCTKCHAHNTAVLEGLQSFFA